MITSNEDQAKVPVVMIDNTSLHAYSIFNSNDWIGESKQIIVSCAAQYSLLNYEIIHLPRVLLNAERLCRSRFFELQKQWKMAPWDVRKTNHLVEIPEYHLYLQAYLAAVKALLDLLVQLVSSEGIVNKKVHGFHKQGNQIGGELLQILHNKAFPRHADLAARLHKLVNERKNEWIDQVGNLRDDLVHPAKGMSLVMFGLEIQSTGDDLKLIRIMQPLVNGQYFSEYAQKTLRNIELFSRDFLHIMKDRPTSG